MNNPPDVSQRLTRFRPQLGKRIGLLLLILSLLFIARELTYWGFGSSYKVPVEFSQEVGRHQLFSGGRWQLHYKIPGSDKDEWAFYPYHVSPAREVTVLVSPWGKDSFPFDWPHFLFQAFFLGLGISILFGSEVLESRRSGASVNRKFFLAVSFTTISLVAFGLVVGLLR